MSLPFLFELRDQYPTAEIYLILKKEFSQLKDLTPLNLQFIYFGKADYPNPWGMFHFKNQFPQLKHADLFYILPPSFSAAFMGFLFQAKNRIGLKGSWRNFLLTEGIPVLKDHHRVEEYRSLLKRKIIDPARFVRSLGENFEPNFLKERVGLGPYLVVNPNSEAPSRRLPLDSWATLLKGLEGFNFFFIGVEKDSTRVEDILKLLDPKTKNLCLNLAGKTDLRELTKLLANSQGLITNDSGPAHLGNFLGIPVAVFFGAGNPHNTAPYFGDRKNLLIMREEIKCSPCLKNTCPLKTLSCLKDLKLEFWISEMKKFFINNKNNKQEGTKV